MRVSVSLVIHSVSSSWESFILVAIWPSWHAILAAALEVLLKVSLCYPLDYIRCYAGDMRPRKGGHDAGDRSSGAPEVL